jgi:4-hydroxy-3-methylbut-2-enyl diphosphate reductase
MGMCFGVRDALEIVGQIADPARATIHGALVHNEEVLKDLERRGFQMTSESSRENLPSTATVVITAHGISGRERLRLRTARKELVDTTCPLVRRVHEAACELQRQGYLVLVIGKRNHVEVAGIIGDLDRYEVVQGIDEVRCYETPRLGIVCQSTTQPAEAERIRRAIEEKNPGKEVRFEDTICRPTRERQQAALELLQQVDALVVVGGRHSNNTRQLVELAQSHGVPVLHVQTGADVDPAWLAPFQVVGLTAGTSTLDATIEEVYRALVELER